MRRSLAGNLQQIRSAWRMDSNKKICSLRHYARLSTFELNIHVELVSPFLCYDSGWAHSIMKTLACGVIMSRLEHWHAHVNILLQHYAEGTSKRNTKVHTIRNHSCSINTGLVIQQHALHWDPASVSRSYIILCSLLSVKDSAHHNLRQAIKQLGNLGGK